LLTRLCKYQLPCIENINIRRPRSSDLRVHNQINHFLTHSFPLKIKKFELTKRGSDCDEMGDYFDSFIAIQGRVTYLIVIKKFMITEDQVKKIMEAHSNSEMVSIEQCDWGSFEDAFSISNSIQFNTTELYLAYAKNMSNETFENLVKGLSNNESLKQKLEKSNIVDCGVKNKEVKKIFKKHGFENVTVYCADW
jgi:hypothetical protein